MPRRPASPAPVVAAALALTACGPSHPSTPLSAAACADELRAQHDIDVAPAPRICAPLREAILQLGDDARAAVRGLVIVRDARGPCGGACPDLASALMSDAALAYYRFARHELHVVDATFDGPRWRGGAPDAAALRAYLDGLGLADWPALVERVRALPGAALPAAVPEGSPLVLDAIVRAGPAALLGGEVPLAHLLLHELGHVVLLGGGNEASRIAAWSTLSGWGETDDPTELADGFVGGGYAGERAIVASRLLLALPRGTDVHYLPGAHPHPAGGLGFPTGYAAFDPVEDHAEAFRLVHTDPEALGRASPARLLVAGAGELDLRRPALRRFVHAGVAALLDDAVDPPLAMATLRAHGAALLPEAADLADPRPLPIPADADAETRAMLATLVVPVGSLTFRPTDAAVARFLAAWLRARADLEEFERSLGG